MKGTYFSLKSTLAQSQKEKEKEKKMMNQSLIQLKKQTINHMSLLKQKGRKGKVK
jgi:hypothetical protein